MRRVPASGIIDLRQPRHFAGSMAEKTDPLACCPKCRHTVLGREVVAGVPVDRCPTCRGLRFERGDLSKLLAQRPEGDLEACGLGTLSEIMDTVPAQCFRCARPMDTFKATGGVRMDVCRNCGSVFLDQGELATLQRHQSEQ